jgi:LacI family transcriptional regulator
MTDGQPGVRRIATLKDVAREAGVSIAAVSYSLNGGGTISNEVRARVREVAGRLGYRPNRSAQAVRTGRSMTLGLVLPDLNNPYYPALARSFEHAARQAGYTTILIDTSGSVEEELEGIRQLENHGVAGAIWCQTSDKLAASARDYAMPIVVVGAPGAAFDNVMADDVAGGRIAARHLLARGHRDIGLLVGDSVPEDRNDRRNAFVATIAHRARLCFELRTPYAIDLDGRVVETLARREVTAVMCGNDLIAIGVLRAARQLGIEVPEDLSVVGFDDIPWAAIVTPALTTINQPVAEMAGVALQLLLDRLEKPGRPLRHMKVPVSLVERDSVVDWEGRPPRRPFRQGRSGVAENGRRIRRPPQGS